MISEATVGVPVFGRDVPTQNVSLPIPKRVVAVVGVAPPLL